MIKKSIFLILIIVCLFVGVKHSHSFEENASPLIWADYGQWSNNSSITVNYFSNSQLLKFRLLDYWRSENSDYFSRTFRPHEEILDYGVMLGKMIKRGRSAAYFTVGIGYLNGVVEKSSSDSNRKYSRELKNVTTFSLPFELGINWNPFSVFHLGFKAAGSINNPAAYLLPQITIGIGSSFD